VSLSPSEIAPALPTADDPDDTETQPEHASASPAPLIIDTLPLGFMHDSDDPIETVPLPLPLPLPLQPLTILISAALSKATRPPSVPPLPADINTAPPDADAVAPA
jgi:hypothetical protein